METSEFQVRGIIRVNPHSHRCMEVFRQAITFPGLPDEEHRVLRAATDGPRHHRSKDGRLAYRESRGRRQT